MPDFLKLISEIWMALAYLESKYLTPDVYFISVPVWDRSQLF